MIQSFCKWHRPREINCMSLPVARYKIGMKCFSQGLLKEGQGDPEDVGCRPRGGCDLFKDYMRSLSAEVWQTRRASNCCGEVKIDEASPSSSCQLGRTDPEANFCLFGSFQIRTVHSGPATCHNQFQGSFGSSWTTQ